MMDQHKENTLQQTGSGSTPPAYAVTMGAAAGPVNPQQPTTAAPPSYAVNIPQQLPQSNVVTSGQPVQYQNQPYPQVQPGRVVVQQAHPQSAVLERYSGRHSIGLGSAQIVLAGLAILLNGIGIGVDASLCEVGHGFWVSIFTITSGTLAIVAGQKKSPGLVSANLGMNIVSCIMGVPGIGLSLAGMVDDFNRWYCDYHCYQYTLKEGVAINAVLSIIFLAEVICCLFVAVLCCSGGGCCPVGSCVCCFGQPQNGAVIMPYQTPQMATMVTTYDGRTVMVPVNTSNNNNNNSSRNYGDGDNDSAENTTEDNGSVDCVNDRASGGLDDIPI